MSMDMDGYSVKDQAPCGDDSPVVATDSAVATVQEVRMKRLLALGILQPQNISKVEATDTACQKKSKHEVVDLVDLRDDSSHEGNADGVVIDLLDDSHSHSSSVDLSEKKEKPSAKRNTVGKNASRKKQPVASQKNQPVAAQPKRASQEAKVAGNGTIFQVATWNVWFGPMGDGEPHAGPRMRSICQLLQEQHGSKPISQSKSPQSHNPLWCIGLQEVISETAQYLQPLLEKAGYQVYRQASNAPYGCAIAVHSSLTVLEHGWRPFRETQMIRGFLHVRAQIPQSNSQILFTTTHLESFCGNQYTGAAQRPKQLLEMQDFCLLQMKKHAHLKVAVMTGDMNWDDERVRSSGQDPSMSSILPAHWKDSWLETRASKNETSYTYDGKMNPMLGGNLRRRFDRIVLTGNSVIAVATQLIGTRALPGLVWSKYNDYTRSTKEMMTAPSDHFGYVATFQMEE